MRLAPSADFDIGYDSAREIAPLALVAALNVDTGGGGYSRRAGGLVLRDVVDGAGSAGRFDGCPGVRRPLSHGNAVVTAEDGLAVLDVLSRYRADAVLLDVRMPGGDGLEVLMRRQTRPRVPPAPC